uniref:Uncharacterized protein n=1 Tax=Avena sativa TaxID=4498 RepID=A0ACD5X204_AVESA
MDVVFREHEPFYGEATNLTDLTDVFPDLLSTEISSSDCKAVEDKHKDNHEASREVVIGVIPAEDMNTIEIEQVHGEGETQGSVNRDLLWSKPNEEQNPQVYTRRHKTREKQAQGELQPLGHDSESHVPVDSHDSTSHEGTFPLPYDDLDIPIAHRKQHRNTTRKLPTKLSQYVVSNHVSYSLAGSKYRSFIASLDSTASIPHDWQEAKKYPRWRAAMLEEMAALDKNNTWVLTTVPVGKKIVGCKWVFTVKQTPEGSDDEEIKSLKKTLAKSFEVKDLGYLHYFLGIEVAYGAQGIYQSQKKYVLDLLAETGMLECRTASTPIEQNHGIIANSGDPIDKGGYQRLVGRLIYLSHTRPDIAYAVSIVSRYMHDPRSGHLTAVNRILRYLKGCPGKGILFSNHGHLRVEGYTNADWAGCLDDRRSTSGYCMFVSGNLVSWRSKKQSVVARSTTEAEFRAMASGLCELMWLQLLLDELRVCGNTRLQLYCDNQATINLINNHVHHDRTKHVGIDRHFIKEKLDDGTLQIGYVKTVDQLAEY